MPTKRRPSIGTFDEVIGRNVHALREGRMSQAALGSEDGVGQYLGRTWPRQVVWKIEHGERNLDAAELVALALVFDVPVTHLLTAHDQIDDEHEISLSDDYVMTMSELRSAVMGAKKAAKQAEARRAAIAQIISVPLIDYSGKVFAPTIQQAKRQGGKRP
jgi:transcriptional regulator with XRE-family HTH domain